MICDITDFGARADRADNRAFIQKAVDACFLAGGGEVRVPKGEFFTGGVRLRSGVTLRLMEDAALVGLLEPDAYFDWQNDEIEPPRAEDMTDIEWTPAPPGGRKSGFEFTTQAFSRWNNALIRAVRAQNIAIIGEKGSRIDGRDCFDPRGEENYRGPHAVNFHNCENVTLSGYAVSDSANWAHAIFFSKRILCENLTISGGHDGVHFRGCEDIIVRNCDIRTGDDCVAGHSNIDMTIEDCYLNTACSAFRLGGKNVKIARCNIVGPAEYVFRGSLTQAEKAVSAKPVKREGHRYNMLSAYTYFSEFSIKNAPVGDLYMKDCHIVNADRLLHYNFSGNEPWQANMPLARARFENVTAEGVTLPLTAYGDSDLPVAIEFDNCRVAISGNSEFMRARYVKSVRARKLEISGAKEFIRNYGDEISLDIDSLAGVTPDVISADEPFFAAAI